MLDLAEDCIRLVNDHTRRVELAKRGLEVVHGDFSYQKFANIVRHEVERALRERFCKSNAWDQDVPPDQVEK